MFNCLVVDLLDLKELVTEAEEKKFPDTPLMQTLIAAISEAEKCASVANQLVCKKVHTRCVDWVNNVNEPVAASTFHKTC